MSNYPDSLSEGTPGAPWNQADPDPLVCDVCGYLNEEDAEAGDPCPTKFEFDDGSGHDTKTTVDCEGTLREQDYCPGCNQPESRCHCDP